MPNEIVRNNRQVPVISFFGTRGGVGKSTIAQYVAELLLSAPGTDGNGPSVLLVDLDVHHRQLTRQYMESTFANSPTFNDLVSLDDPSKVCALNVTAQVKIQKGTSDDRNGELYFIPSASREDVDAYLTGAKADPGRVKEIMVTALQQAVDSHQVSCIVIDCTAIIDMYTAVAAEISDAALCITLAEPAAFDRVDDQSARISAIRPQFSDGFMKTVVNKYLRADRLDDLKKTRDIYHAIPFTKEVLDETEGFDNIDELRLAIFKDYVVQLLEKVFRFQWPELIPPPSIAFPAYITHLATIAPRLKNSRWMKILRAGIHLTWIGLLLSVIGIGGLTYSSRMPSNVTESERTRDLSYTEVAAYSYFTDRTATSNASILFLLFGGVMLSAGLTARKRNALLNVAIDSLVQEREIWLMRQLEKGKKEQRTVMRLFEMSKGLPETNQFLERQI